MKSPFPLPQLLEMDKSGGIVGPGEGTIQLRLDMNHLQEQMKRTNRSEYIPTFLNIAGDQALEKYEGFLCNNPDDKNNLNKS